MSDVPSIQHANDKLFKRTFQVNETIVDYLTHFAPEHLKNAINQNKLILDATNYISNRLSESFSDVVYNSVWKASSGKVVLLFEHKSAPEPKPQRQLLKYKLAIWEKDDQKKTEESTVVSIVFYQGKTQWVRKPMAAALKNSPPEMAKYFPDFYYEFLSVEKTPDDYILRLCDSSILAAMMLLMKKGGDRAFIYQNFASFFKFQENRPEWNQILNTFVEYLLHRNAINLDELQELSEKNTQLSRNMKTQLQEAFISTAEQLRKEGEARGEARGEAKNLRKNIEGLLLKKILSDIQIADALEVELSFVQSIKSTLIKTGRLEE